MGPLIAIVVVLAIAAVGYFVFVRRPALPPSPAQPELPRAPEAKAKPEPEPEPEPEEATGSQESAAVSSAEDGDADVSDVSDDSDVSDVSDDSADPADRLFLPPGATAPTSSPARPSFKRAPEPVPLPRDKPKRAEPGAAAETQRRQQQQQRYAKGLEKTRGGFVARLSRLLRGKPKVDDELRDKVEEVLFTADIGSATAQKLLDRVTEVLNRADVAEPDAVWAVIRQASLELLDLPAPEPDYTPDSGPYVLLMIGVNGVGKTTTLGKLAARHVNAGRKVLLVAGDTFRAAAVEQLDVWARRVGCDLHKGADKADPSSVIFAGISRARKENYDVVLCDTAGRLHTRKELMDELVKVGKATTKAIAQGVPPADRAAVTGPHDTFLALDATIGQNALAQAKLFKETMDFTGLVVTKLDGTAKGGVVLGICDEMQVPIRYIGIGESVDDLRDFNAADFADALYADRSDDHSASTGPTPHEQSRA